MQFTPGYLFGMVLQTIPEPRKVARDLFDVPVARKVRWLVLFLMVVLAAILGVVSHAVYPVDAEMFGPILSNPMTLGVLEGVFLSVGVWAIYLLGRMAGGQGSLDDAITIAIWLELVLLAFQTATLVLSLFAPAMAGLLMVISSAVSHDLLKRTFKPDMTEKQEMRAARFAAAAAVICAGLLDPQPFHRRKPRVPIFWAGLCFHHHHFDFGSVCTVVPACPHGCRTHRDGSVACLISQKSAPIFQSCRAR